MGTYTVEVRRICQAIAEQAQIQTFDDVESLIKIAYPKIFADYIPFFDDSYKAILLPKILRHYYTREIGLETVGLWKLKVNTKLAEIMPYYNQLYKSELLKYDPLTNVQYSLKSKRTFDGKNVLDGTVKTDTDNVTDFKGTVNTDNTDTDTTNTDRTTNTTTNIEQNVNETFEKNTTHEKGTVTTTKINEEDSLTHGKKETKEYNITDTKTGENTTRYNGSELTKNTVPNEFETLTKYSDTPQGTIDNVKAGKYLTNVTAVTTPKSETDSERNFVNRSDVISLNETDKKGGTEGTLNSGTDTTIRTGTDTTTNSGSDVDKETGTNTNKTTATNTDNTVESITNKRVDVFNGLADTKNITDFNGSVLGKTDNTTKIDNIDDYIESVFGKQGTETYSEMLMKFRNTFLNIDMLVIDNLESLFMGLW